MDEASYMTVAERKALAHKRAEVLRDDGHLLHPVSSKLRGITAQFWGRAWVQHLQRFAYYEHALPRGRSLLKNDQVIDLQIQRGQVSAWVSDQQLQRVILRIQGVDEARWQSLKLECLKDLDSALGLLQNQLPAAVMERVSHPESGLFPEVGEVRFQCDCVEDADPCSHGAAVLYGVGLCLDLQPRLLFDLRGIDPYEWLDTAKLADSLTSSLETSEDLGDLEKLFGIDLDNSSLDEE